MSILEGHHDRARFPPDFTELAKGDGHAWTFMREGFMRMKDNFQYLQGLLSYRVQLWLTTTARA